LNVKIAKDEIIFDKAKHKYSKILDITGTFMDILETAFKM
jgi:hypothetical protein